MAETTTTSSSHFNDQHLLSRHHDRTIPQFQRLPRVEKDADDTNSPPIASPNTERQTNTTFTTLSRLLGATSLSSEGSRASSYINDVQQQGYIRNLHVKETAPLPDHLFSRGLCQGRHSDITVHAFGDQYKLHRIILDRAPFFATALSGPWLEAKSSEITIHPEEIDSNITQHGFELALKRLYRGTADVEREDRHATELFATGCWLEMPDLIEASIESILRQMSTDHLGPLISLVTKNYYGRAGDKILASAKAMLCRDGWKMRSRYWDTIPADIVNEIVSSDGFYIDGEWERWVLAKRIVARRLRTKALECGLLDPASMKPMQKQRNLTDAQTVRPSITSHGVSAEYTSLYGDAELAPLFDLLDNGIHYVHLEFEQLQHIRAANDVFGFPVLPDKVISSALWQQMELRQRVLNCEEADLDLGFAVEAPSPTSTTTSAQQTNSQSGIKHEGDTNDTSSAQHHELEADSGDEVKGPRQYWIPAADCNIVMGGNSDPIISISHNSGSVDNARPRRSIDTKDKEIEQPVCYSKLPPFRFSAEFPSPKLIKEKKRAYSRTVFYAGSLWNIYIQKVASIRSTKQLGVYLHRVKERETEDVVLTAGGTSSVPSVVGRIGMLEREMIKHRLRQAINASQRTHRKDDSSTAESMQKNSAQSSTQHPGESKSLATATFSTFSDMDNDDSDVDNDGDTHIPRSLGLNSDWLVPTLPSYVDLRPTIKTYFKIFSPSRGGRMLSVYESAPDKFNFSQSWGWKSSTLMLDEGLLSQDESDNVIEHTSWRDEGGAEDGDGDTTLLSTTKEEGFGRKTVRSLGDGKLRFMVVIGIL